MNDILKKVQEEWDRLMGCDVERDDKAGFNAVYRGHQHARDRAVAIAILEADVEYTKSQLVPLDECYETDRALGFGYGCCVAWNAALKHVREKIRTYKQQAIEELSTTSTIAK